MKAYRLHEIGDIRLEEVEQPIAGGQDVIVRVKAAGICGSDIPRIYYTGTYSYPLIPGHEFSGEVAEVGAGVESSLLGKRVGVFPLIPCGECEPCKHQQYELCRHYSYLGSRTAGGFAEYVKVPQWNLFPLPEQVSYEQAAMLEPMCVAVHAIRRARLTVESHVAIAGLGTIGLFVMMFLRDMGISNLYLIGNKEFQQKVTDGQGLFCNSRTTDVEQWLADKHIDVFFDCVGKNEIVNLAVKTTAPNGQIILVGNPASDMMLERTTYWKILRNQLRVTGTWNSSFTHSADDDWHYCMERLASGRIHPEQYITHRLPFDRLIQGAEMMRDKTEDYIKVIAVCNGEIQVHEKRTDAYNIGGLNER